MTAADLHAVLTALDWVLGRLRRRFGPLPGGFTDHHHHEETTMTTNMEAEDCVDWDGYWGRCPTCHGPGKNLDVGRSHWGVCHDHKVFWPVGDNLFSAWRDQTDDEREANIAFLQTCARVEPYRLPPEEAAVLNAARKAEEARNPPSPDADGAGDGW